MGQRRHGGLLERIQVLAPRLVKADARYASWRATLSAPGEPSSGARAASCTFQADENIHAGYTGMVEGYQREIAALAEAIVAVLTSPANNIDAPCQVSIEGSAGGSRSKDY